MQAGRRASVAHVVVLMAAGNAGCRGLLSAQPTRNAAERGDPVGDLADRAGRIAEDEARRLGALAVPGQRVHLHAARQRSGREVGVGEGGGEGDHQVQAGRGTVDARARKVRAHRADHRIAAAAVAPAEHPQLAFQFAGFHQLAEYQTRFGDWRQLFRDLDKIDAVTKADIRRVANKIFLDSNRTSARIEYTAPKKPANTPQEGQE